MGEMLLTRGNVGRIADRRTEIRTAAVVDFIMTKFALSGSRGRRVLPSAG